MKKILMVCEAFGGGVFTYVSQLCNDIVDLFDVYLVYSVRPQTPKNYKIFLDDRINLIEIEKFGNIKSISSDIKVIGELRKIEKEVKPDIIHLHSSIAGGIGRIAFKGKYNTVIYTPHGYAHILMGRSKRTLIYEIIERILGQTNSMTLTCCESEDEVAKTFCEKTAYIETGVNLKELSTALDKIKPVKNTKFTVFTLGRICNQKQPALFNQIAELVPEAKFVWIGNGAQEHLLTAPNIEITGWKERKEALAIAKGADVYVLCSFGEAIAMSLIENMFIKKLCLVSNTMGNKSVIQNGINGYLCEQAEDYAQRIKAAMRNPPSELIENAYSDVKTIYNTDIMKKKYVKFYNDVIDGKYR
ncbi:glycosyltransferase [Clostridium sp. MCC353]|uniref:glycosyltransferase n=1 Tax=Clostridium sp. MCC353 TaxID=2592646 RepID=UPI001C02E3EA|nr:glycosyltransferase [Clostridium sp. MCC353]MBT9777075.1 glycosyltransferase [Clostridium sp. MCC353]